jgi:hypothetical protein
MKYKILLLSACLGIFLSFSPYLKKFPAFNYATVSGKPVSNDIFKGKKTIVVLAHLGCPAAMQLVQDLQSIPDTSHYQFLFIYENTRKQILDFNSDTKNDWSAIRERYKLKPLDLSKTVGECESEKIELTKEGTMIANSQCSIISRKLMTADSPSVYYIDENGMITNEVRGYPATEDRNERVGLFLNPFTE